MQTSTIYSVASVAPHHHWWIIMTFSVVIVIMLMIDLGIFNKKNHTISSREALIWTIVWIVISLLFGLVVYFESGLNSASDYIAAYLIEKSLSMDNIFVFILIFSYFNVPSEYKHKVLFYGIIGAILFRAIFIFAGVELIKLTYLPPFVVNGTEVQLNVVLTIFGFFLLYAGLKSFNSHKEDQKDFSKNIVVRIAHRLLPFSKEYDKGKFFTKQNGKRLATPLFLVVLVIESTDILFAVDSIPAIFAITNDPFILYTSNIFAILGLRALYFLLANLMPLFRFLHYGLAVILIFIGAKMLIADFIEIPSPVSLVVVVTILTVSILLSVLIKEEKISADVKQISK
jgi:tellurite resistance protein TerC